MTIDELMNMGDVKASPEMWKEWISEFSDPIRSDKCFGRLYVKNFGSLQCIDILINNFNIFIGQNNTGKSTLARILAIVLDFTLNSKSSEKIRQSFIDSEISFFQEDTIILFVSKLNTIFLSSKETISHSKLIIKEGSLETISNVELHHQIESLLELTVKDKKKIKNRDTINKLKKVHGDMNKVSQQVNQLLPIYIPAERNLISLVSGSLFSLMNSNIPLSKMIIRFGANYELARKRLLKINLPALNIEYRYENGEDRIFISNNYSLPLSNASSSVQSITPLAIVLEYLGRVESASILVEEPEMNLFPDNQRVISQYLASFCKGNILKTVTITTHSPYILSAFNNLIVAGTLAQEKPELEDEIEKIISKESWIKFNDVSAYVLENGTTRSILDSEWKAIVAEDIDQASENIGIEYDRLLALKYQSSSKNG